jgi:hypothetical protein
MDEKQFLKNFIQPSEKKLNETIIYPLPKIEGLRKCGEFIVQGEQEETFSTNLVTRYVSDSLGIRLLEAYKSTEHKGSGVFIRLIGTLTLVKTGYPILFFDAAVTNVSPITTEREDLTTRVAIHLPQADPEQRHLFFSRVRDAAEKDSVSYRELEVDTVPKFWGSVWLGESKGLDLDMIRRTRDNTWLSYKDLFENTKERSPFDYRPLQEHMVFNVSVGEHESFEKMGMSVPVEAQAAYFTLLVYGG